MYLRASRCVCVCECVRVCASLLWICLPDNPKRALRNLIFNWQTEWGLTWLQKSRHVWAAYAENEMRFSCRYHHKNKHTHTYNCACGTNTDSWEILNLNANMLDYYDFLLPLAVFPLSFFVCASVCVRTWIRVCVLQLFARCCFCCCVAVTSIKCNQKKIYKRHEWNISIICCTQIVLQHTHTQSHWHTHTHAFLPQLSPLPAAAHKNSFDGIYGTFSSGLIQHSTHMNMHREPTLPAILMCPGNV